MCVFTFAFQIMMYLSSYINMYISAYLTSNINIYIYMPNGSATISIYIHVF